MQIISYSVELPYKDEVYEVGLSPYGHYTADEKVVAIEHHENDGTYIELENGNIIHFNSVVPAKIIYESDKKIKTTNDSAIQHRQEIYKNGVINYEN
ncbi:hypothetical protein [Staphylococcus coagulans]|uniref:hypothetical protein n=1 Tax=Staphylococcus coagulans TaxID=74706 RepID=UPI001BE9B3BE|nr:hypothetical protein [Staphylococcus coagulans]MBT2818512.1 hypothetical protein [Staphylococcus coagulans]